MCAPPVERTNVAEYSDKEYREWRERREKSLKEAQQRKVKPFFVKPTKQKDG